MIQCSDSNNKVAESMGKELEIKLVEKTYE